MPVMLMTAEDVDRWLVGINFQVSI